MQEEGHQSHDYNNQLIRVIFVALHPAKLGNTAGMQAGRLAVQQTKFGRGLKFQKLTVDQNI